MYILSSNAHSLDIAVSMTTSSEVSIYSALKLASRSSYSHNAISLRIVSNHLKSSQTDYNHLKSTPTYITRYYHKSSNRFKLSPNHITIHVPYHHKSSQIVSNRLKSSQIISNCLARSHHESSQIITNRLK
jgi:hypothetical protein